MKNKNMRELEKRWSTEAAKQRRAAKPVKKNTPPPENGTGSTAPATTKATKS